MGAIKIKGSTSGSTTITAPATGSDETIELSTALASKLDLAGGKILQIVRATDATDRTTSSSTYVDASISVTITPQKSDSAILLIWNVSLYNNASGGNAQISITDSSNNAISGAENCSTYGSNSAVQVTTTAIAYATPATTSAVTYKGRFRGQTGTATLFNAAAHAGQLYAIEVSA